MNKFRAFYNEHKDKLFAYLMRMTGDYYLSSDIMQESFTRYLEHYGHEKQSIALLYKIGRNALIDNARKENRNKPLQNDQEDCAMDQESALMIREQYRKVIAALQKLKKDERDILSLSVGNDLSYREIASILGISEANVKVKVHRSRLKLKNILQTGNV
ncbi:MAG: sigma-70 family RNA polymerase sigma factor [Desulfobacterales bacterium]|nr:sigma-70 family RNA polymerase sigma factor [Desulfobacterales bacterium]